MHKNINLNKAEKTMHFALFQEMSFDYFLHLEGPHAKHTFVITSLNQLINVYLSPHPLSTKTKAELPDISHKLFPLKIF